MHSETLEKTGSPRKRTLSRGMSEDESLRSIIKETESSSRRLTRSDSRCGTLKRGSDTQQSDRDLLMELPEMLELQASYEEVLQELRRVELEREGLVFQVDVLQDTLEGAEELLAEAQREAGQVSMELEREREAKRKLEDMVGSLMQELERLKEERNTIPAVPVYTLVREQEREEEMTMKLQAQQIEKDAREQIAKAQGKDDEASPGAPLSVVPLDNTPAETQKGDTSAVREGSALESGEAGQEGEAEEEGNPLAKLQRMVNKTFGQIPSLALGGPPAQDGVLMRPQAEDGQDADGNNDTDSISAYEDASAETPELDNIFPGASDREELELPDDGGTAEDGEEHPNDHSQANDSCILS